MILSQWRKKWMSPARKKHASSRIIIAYHNNIPTKPSTLGISGRLDYPRFASIEPTRSSASRSRTGPATQHPLESAISRERRAGPYKPAARVLRRGERGEADRPILMKRIGTARGLVFSSGVPGTTIDSSFATVTHRTRAAIRGARAMSARARGLFRGRPPRAGIVCAARDSGA